MSEHSKQESKHDTSSQEEMAEIPINQDSTIAHSTTKSFGIRKVEILSDQYSAWYLRVILFICIFIVSYVYALDGTLRGVFQPIATASYSTHSLFATVNVIRSVIAAAAQPTYARLSDRFGRLELFVVSIVFYVVGTIIESQATNVQKFAGGAVLYQIGYSGVIFILQVMLADFSNLNWRLVASFVPALPFIINTWVSGDVSSSVLANHSWSYGIAMWAYIYPISCLPLICCFIHMYLKARKTNEWAIVNREEKLALGSKWKSWKDNIFVELFWELDVVGIILIICVLGLILVPFTLAGGVQSKWQQGSIIAPLVIGFVLIPPFVWWEKSFARVPIIPFALITDRGVWSAIMIGILIDFVWYMPNDFMYTVLIVGMRASVKAATRIVSLYSFVSVITGPLLGLLVVYVRRLKGFIIFGVAMWFISLGLLVHFRGDNDGVESKKFLDGVIGSLCLMGFGAGFFTYSTQVSIASVTNHEYMALILSLYLASYNVGAAVGASVSAAMWTQKLYGYLYEELALAGLDTTLATSAYGDPFTFIVTYVWGTPERVAVVLAYARIQRLLCIVGLVLCVPLLFFTLFLRDHRLDSVQSLELNHDHEKAIQADEDAIKGTVIVNNYDDDVVLAAIKRLFKRKLSV